MSKHDSDIIGEQIYSVRLWEVSFASLSSTHLIGVYSLYNRKWKSDKLTQDDTFILETGRADFSLPSTAEHRHCCLLPEGRKGSSTRKMVGKFCIRETSSSFHESTQYNFITEKFTLNTRFLIIYFPQI